MAHYSVGATLAVDLMNTYDVHAGEELLDTAGALADFAEEHGLGRATSTLDDLQRVRSVRPRLREAVLAEDQATAVGALNDLLASASPRPRLVEEDGDWTFAFADPNGGLGNQVVAEAAGQLLQEIREHGLERFSTCDSSTCQDVFVDKSRNHSRRYCTPDVCGNREAQRAYRARRAETTGSDSD